MFCRMILLGFCFRGFSFDVSYRGLGFFKASFGFQGFSVAVVLGPGFL